MLSVEPLKPGDLLQTADLHRQNLKLGLFPRLGRHFLSLYQEGFARSPYGIALVARSDDDEVVGALFGTTANAEHFRWVTRHMGLQLALAGSGAMLIRPQLAFDFARTRMGRYARGLARHIGIVPAPQAAPSGARPVSVLSHIVTAQTVRRCGVGRKLVEAFKARARAKGAHRALLVTEEGGQGTPFFEKLGCRLIDRRQGQDGAILREYRLILDEAGTYEEMDRNRNAGIVVHPYPRRFGTAHSLPVHAPGRH